MEIPQQEKKPKRSHHKKAQPQPETSSPSSELVELDALPSEPEAPAAPPREWTQEALQTFDFTGWDWTQLPFGLVKSARNGGPSVIAAKAECVNCKRAIWTCNIQLENLCEECDYLLRRNNWDERAKQAKARVRKPYNPFADNTELPRIFWPRDE